MGDNYIDGTGGQRCGMCHALLRAADDGPRVAIRVSDIEEIACLLVDYVDCPQTWGPTIRRLEQAVGRTIAQMKADEVEKMRGRMAGRR